MSQAGSRAGITRLVDVVFPGDTNHHGTLFGGAALAHMHKVAFIAAARHGHVDFVTASCERIDFEAPARLGEIVDLVGRVARVGRRSLSVEVELVAEALLTGERRRCAGGFFNMVAVGTPSEGWTLPPLQASADAPDPAVLRMVEMVFPDQTSHYGSLYGGHAMAAMGKAAFVVASRRARRAVVMAATEHVDFSGQIVEGEIVEFEARLKAVGRTSMQIEVALAAENLLTDERRACGRGTFVMVAVDDQQRPTPIESET